MGISIDPVKDAKYRYGAVTKPRTVKSKRRKIAHDDNGWPHYSSTTHMCICLDTCCQDEYNGCVCRSCPCRIGEQNGLAHTLPAQTPEPSTMEAERTQRHNPSRREKRAS